MADTEQARPKRLHERVETKLDVIVHKRRVQALDWSRSGMALPEDAVPEEVGSRLSVEARFPVPGGLLAVPLTVEVAARRAGRVGLRFVDLNDEQLALLRRLVAGQAPAVTASQDPPPRSAAGRAGKGGRQHGLPDRRTAIVGLAALVVLAAVLLAAMRILQPSEAAYAAVTQAERSLEAPAAGRVIEVLATPGDQVGPGTAILRLRPEGGVPLLVTAPCACTVTAVPVTAGDAVTPGMALAVLGDPSAPPLVEALVKSKTADRLTPGQTVSVTVAGLPGTHRGTVVEAPPVAGGVLPPTLTGRPDLQQVWVAVEPTEATVDPGTPARVRFAGALDRLFRGL